MSNPHPMIYSAFSERSIQVSEDLEPDAVNPVQRAFKDWQQAAGEWAKAHNRFEQSPEAFSEEQMERLLALEARLNQAADALERALRNSSWSDWNSSQH